MESQAGFCYDRPECEALLCREESGKMGMDVYAVLDQVIALLRSRGRVTCNALQLQFNLDDAQLAILKAELLR